MLTWRDVYVFPRFVPTEEYAPQAKYLFAPSWTWDSCVNFFKWRVGIQGTLGNAGDIIANSDVAVLRYGMLFNNHISFIEKIEGNIATISETNWIAGRFTIRQIELTDPSIRGYFRPPTIAQDETKGI